MKKTYAKKSNSNIQQKEMTGNRFFHALTLITLRYRWPILIVTLAATAFMGYATATRIQINTTMEGFLAADSEEFVTLEELRDQFGQDTVFQVLVGGEVFSMQYLNRLKKLHDELAALNLEIKSLGQRSRLRLSKEKGSDSSPKKTGEDDAFDGFQDSEGWGDEGGGTIVDEIISLINVRQTSWIDGGLNVAGLLDIWPTAEELPSLKKRVLSNRTWVGQVIDEDATQSVIIIRTAFMSEKDRALVYEAIARIAKAHETDDFKIMVSGWSSIMTALNKLLMSDVVISFVVVNIIIVVIFLVLFRSPIGVIGPVMVMWLAEIWTLGTMALTNMPMTLVTTILPAFLACVGLGDSVHIQSVYRDARRKRMSNIDAIIYAVETTGIPVFYTTLTTAVGLLSFRFASLDAIGDMGTFGALGVTFAFINSVVFLPIVLSFNKKSLLGLPKKNNRQNAIDYFLNYCNGLSRPRQTGGRLDFTKRNRILVFSVGLALVAVLGMSLLRFFHDPLTWMPKDNPTLNALLTFEDTVGGTMNVALLVKAKEGKDLKDRELLLALERLEKHVLAFEDVGNKERMVRNTTSLLDPVRESWQAVNDEKKEFYKIPDTDQGVTDMLTLFEQTGPDQLKRHVSVDMKRALLVARVKWMETLSYLPLAEHIEQGIENIIGNMADITTTGSVNVQIAVFAALLMDLIKSYGAAILVITLIMIVLLKEIKLGILAMIPNLLPIFSIMGFMGYASIHFDINTVLLGSVAIGIAVDDTIHLLHQFRIHYSEHGNVEQAIEHAFHHTGRAMVLTSLVLVFSFMCMLVGDLSFVRRFGILISAIVTFALVLDLCLIPALLRRFYK
ncbi:MAG: MMPL family transporter [Proteobacteria bacterium]|nr:MMPL family transporter [Pseudomonadota bacterium]